jgi:hypothetical protein
MNGSQTGSSQTFIRYDPQRTDLSVSEAELDRLCAAAYNHWKDFFLVSLPLAVSCLINAVAGTPKPFSLALPLFLNYLIGGLALALSLIFLVLWLKSRGDFKDVVETIKNKPKYLVQMSQSGGGDTPALELRD